MFRALKTGSPSGPFFPFFALGLLNEIPNAQKRDACLFHASRRPARPGRT